MVARHGTAESTARSARISGRLIGTMIADSMRAMMHLSLVVMSIVYAVDVPGALPAILLLRRFDYGVRGLHLRFRAVDITH